MRIYQSAQRVRPGKTKTHYDLIQQRNYTAALRLIHALFCSIENMLGGQL